MSQTIKNIIIFILIFTYFFLLQSTSHFADPDSFYNTKMALLMKEQFIFKEFPWLQFSVLKDNYIDHHFLYHVFLIPFVSLAKIGINPLLGVAISALFFATLLIFIFYLILKGFKIRYPLFFIFLLLISAPFIFRISLARAPAISGVFLMLGSYFILRSRSESTPIAKRKNAKIIDWPLFFISFFYVWLYSAWLLLPVILFFYLVAARLRPYGPKSPPDLLDYGGQVLNFYHKLKGINFKKILKDSWVVLVEEKNKIISVFSGLTSGLIINPYFPHNLKFYYHQIYQIAVVNFHTKFGVGSEWYPYDPIVLYKNLFLFFIILLTAIALFFVCNKKQDSKSWSLFLVTGFFFLYTIKARRTVEYFVPFSVLFIAFVYDNIFEKKSWAELEQKFKDFFSQTQRMVLITLTGLIVFIAPYFIYHDLVSIRQQLRHLKFDHLQKVSQWFKENVPPGTTIFNTNWDEFGFLFYYNSNNYYITGLDQTFMYAYNPALLELYVDIAQGINVINLKGNLKNKFNSDYILLSKERNKKFYDNLTHLKKDFELVYEDEEASVFKAQ